jgi:hypothetical protein
MQNPRKALTAALAATMLIGTLAASTPALAWRDCRWNSNDFDRDWSSDWDCGGRWGYVPAWGYGRWGYGGWGVAAGYPYSYGYWGSSSCGFRC